MREEPALTPMTVIEEIKAKLTKYPGVKFTNGADYIAVTPSTDQGFEVALSVIAGRKRILRGGRAAAEHQLG